MLKSAANLNRNIARFNKRHPELAIEIQKVTTKREYNQAYRRFERAKAQRKFLAEKSKVLQQAKDYGVKVNANKIRGAKSLANLKAKVDPIRKFTIAQDKFIDRAAAYNAKVQAGEIPNKSENKFFQLPRNMKEVAKFNRALTLLEKKNVDAAKKVMDVKPKERLSTALLKRDRDLGKLKDEFTFAEKQYFNTAIREAGNSLWPALAEMFKIIGVRGVSELAASDFTIADFAESQREHEEFNAETIIEMVKLSLDSLSPAVRFKIIAFLKDY